MKGEGGGGVPDHILGSSDFSNDRDCAIGGYDNLRGKVENFQRGVGEIFSERVEIFFGGRGENL